MANSSGAPSSTLVASPTVATFPSVASKTSVAMAPSASGPSHPPPSKSLSPASPVKALQSLMFQNSTGRLTIQAQGDSVIKWKLHVGQGQLHYANSLVGDRDRLAYLLPQVDPKLKSLVHNLPRFMDVTAYDWLCEVWQAGELNLATLRMIIQTLSQEALGKILAIEHGIFQFDRAIGIDPILIAVPFKTALSPVVQSLKTWQDLAPHITSPLQRVGFAPATAIPELSLRSLRQQVGPEATTTLQEALEHQPCFYQLAVDLDMQITPLAQLLRPLIQEGYLTLHPYVNPPRTQRPTVACIDDSPTVQRTVKLVLQKQGYQVLSITNPLQAVNILAGTQPDLILLDISMPQMDGYNLCRLLRQQNQLKETPIVMLTGRDTVVDKVRSRFLGASGYVTKPFDMRTLTDVVTRYVIATQD